jgi:hypothetical protein
MKIVDSKKLILDIAGNMFSGSNIRFCSDGDFRIYKPEYEVSGFITNYLRFVHNAKILTMGCSVTAGVGVGDEFSWPNIIRQNTGMTLNSVAFPGISIPQISSVFFEFISIYGKPEYLLILLPEITRQWVYIDEQPYRQRLSWDDEAQCFWSHDGDGYLRRNRKGQHLLLKACIQNSLSSLIQISDACKLMGIKFAFYSWEESDNKAYESTPINGYLEEPEGLYDEDKYKMTEKTESFWKMGVDNAHVGALEHLRYAERFSSFLGK